MYHESFYRSLSLKPVIFRRFHVMSYYNDSSNVALLLEHRYLNPLNQV